MSIFFISFLVLTSILALIVIGLLSWYLMPMVWARCLIAAGRAHAGLKSRYLETDSGKWHYLSGGHGPVLLAIHGFGGDADNWLKIAPKLTRQFTVIAPDLPGFGSSSTANNLAFDIDSQTERLHTFIKLLGIRPTILVGSSMGGWIAATYARRYSSGVKAIWLLGPLGVADDKTSPIQRSIEANEGSPFQVENLHQFRHDLLDRMFVRRPWFPYPLQVFYSREAIKLRSRAPGMFQQIRQSTESLESITAKLTIPILLQWGDQDQAVDVSGAQAMKKTSRKMTVCIQENVGHLPMLETPKESLGFFSKFCAHHGLTNG